jgi:uncharacterized membrane protein
MMRISSFSLGRARLIAALLWGSLCALVFGAPLLSAHGRFPILASIAYLFFAPVCHQRPDRSFYLLGHPLAVCHRCSGIYIGLLAGCFFPDRLLKRMTSSGNRRILVLAASMPLTVDVVLDYFDLWSNGPLSRAASGLIFGMMLSLLLVSGIAELMDSSAWTLAPYSNSHTNGGDS